MKRRVALLLGLLLVTVMLAGCVSKQRDVYYGDVKLKWVDKSYEPEYPDNDEWQMRKGREAAEGLDLAKADDFLEYLAKIDRLILRYFVISNGCVTDIVHFQTGGWVLRYWRGEHVMCSDVAIFYVRDDSGEIFHEDAVCDGDVMPWE